MSVLVECISVIVRIEAIKRSYPGGWDAFFKDCPNETLCFDNDLARVGFMVPDHTKRFTARLEAAGLVFLRDGQAIDLAVADQQRGFTTPCSWAEVGHMYINDDEAMKVAVCRTVGSTEDGIYAPDGWQFKGSLSEKFTFVPSGMVPEFMDFLRREGRWDVYRDLRTGKEVFLPRTDS